jgi:hypothetical protein
MIKNGQEGKLPRSGLVHILMILTLQVVQILLISKRNL